jgi:hypothetical protein
MSVFFQIIGEFVKADVLSFEDKYDKYLNLKHTEENQQQIRTIWSRQHANGDKLRTLLHHSDFDISDIPSKYISS